MLSFSVGHFVLSFCVLVICFDVDKAIHSKRRKGGKDGRKEGRKEGRKKGRKEGRKERWKEERMKGGK